MPDGAPSFPPPVEDPDELTDILTPYDGIPEQQVPLYRSDDPCALLDPYDFVPWFIQWQTWSMKGESFSPSHVVESLTWFDLPAAEEAAYDAPFPSRVYMAGPRTFPSSVVAEAGDTAQAWEMLSGFEGPLVTIWGSNDHLDIGACEVQDRFICGVAGAEGQPHARIPEASHYLADDQGAELGARLVAFIQADPSFTSTYAGNCDPAIGDNGVGMICTDDTQCEGQAADTCLVVSADGGICTIEGCAGGDCGAGNVCCRECSPPPGVMLPFDPSACFPASSAEMLMSQAGCTCD